MDELAVESINEPEETSAMRNGIYTVNVRSRDERSPRWRLAPRRSRPQIILVALLSFGFAAGLCGMAAQAADVSVFVSGSGNEFGMLDVNTGVFTQIGLYPLPYRRGDVDNVYGLGFTGPGQLSAIDQIGNVYAVDPTNANLTLLTSTGIFPSGGGGDRDGHLYFFNTGGAPPNPTPDFDSVNVGTGVVTTVASFPAGNDGFVAVGSNGDLFVTGVGANGDDLFRIDPSNGLVTDLGPTGVSQLFAGVFAGSTLYGFDPFGGIYTVNTLTGAATFMGTCNLPDGDLIYSVAFSPQSVPEPSTLILGGFGVLFVAGALRCRCRR
jgi:PEP-CTERM motif